MKDSTREDVVKEFMKAMKQPVGVKNPTAKLLEFRYNLLLEEVKELGEEIAIAMAETAFKDGIPDKVMIRILKEAADVQYVLSGLVVTLDLPMQEAFNRVHKSNMSKLDDEGNPIYREDGKVMKGPNYAPPNLESLVEEVYYTTSEGVV